MASSNGLLTELVSRETSRRWCQTCSNWRPSLGGVLRAMGNRHGTTTDRWVCAACTARRRAAQRIEVLA